MKHHYIIYLACLLIFSCTKTSEKQEDTPPNIIYILADDMGYGDVQLFHPSNPIQTPQLNNLAKEGMMLTDAHTSSSVCTPTRYGILTGRYNWRSSLKSGVLTGTSGPLIKPSQTTVATMLQQHGYHTAFIGKWHLGWNWAKKDPSIELGSGWNPEDYNNIDFTKPITNGPKSLGFDYSYGHAGSLDMAPYVYVENDTITAVPNKTTVDRGKYTWWREGPTGSDFNHHTVTPNFFNRAIDYITRQSTKQNPFFLYLALPSPHTPILPSQEWQNKSGLNTYADFVMQIDHYIGQLNQTLKKLNIEENTLIVFTTDNGCSPQANFEELALKNHLPNANFRGHKADIYEGGHRVPFIIKWPKMIKTNSKNNNTICTTDFMATCAEILDINLTNKQAPDSFSLLPLLNGQGQYQREFTIHHSINGSFAIRQGPWKLIACPGSGGWSSPKPDSELIEELPQLQLYHLINDPSETKNLIESQPKIVENLSNLLLNNIANGRSTPGPQLANDQPLSGEWTQLISLKERLKPLTHSTRND